MGVYRLEFPRAVYVLRSQSLKILQSDWSEQGLYFSYIIPVPRIAAGPTILPFLV